MNIRSAAFTALAAVGIAALGASSASATTFANANDTNSIIYFGSPDTTNYGETFAAPGGALQDWQFTFNGGNPGSADLVIAAWDGTRAVGPALYHSADKLYSGGTQTLDFSGINLSLTTGNSYIAYLTVAGVTNPVSGVSVEGSLTDAGLGGGFVFLNSAGVDPLSLPDAWESFSVPDMKFSATFGTSNTGGGQGVPEPASIALMGAGLLGLAGLRRRQRA